MRTRISVLLAALLTVVPMPTGAYAQLPPCAPRDEMVKRLAETYQETPAAYGLVGGQAVMEVFVKSENGDSWTIIVTRTNGDSCVLAAGSGWQLVDRVGPKA